MKKIKISLNNRRLNTFPDIGNHEIGQQFDRDCLSFFMKWNNIEKSSFMNIISKLFQGVYILMDHIFVTFECLFYHNHVLSLSRNFELFLDVFTRKGYIRQLVGFK